VRGCFCARIVPDSGIPILWLGLELSSLGPAIAARSFSPINWRQTLTEPGRLLSKEETSDSLIACGTLSTWPRQTWVHDLSEKPIRLLGYIFNFLTSNASRMCMRNRLRPEWPTSLRSHATTPRSEPLF